jgi:hypothetical protein
LFLEVSDVLQLQLGRLCGALLFAVSGLQFVVDAFQVGVAFELFVAGECRVLLVVVAACEADRLSGAFAAIALDPA